MNIFDRCHHKKLLLSIVIYVSLNDTQLLFSSCVQKFNLNKKKTIIKYITYNFSPNFVDYWLV